MIDKVVFVQDVLNDYTEVSDAFEGLTELEVFDLIKACSDEIKAEGRDVAQSTDANEFLISLGVDSVVCDDNGDTTPEVFAMEGVLQRAINKL